VKRIILICLTLASTLSVLPFIEPPVLGEETKTIWVAHRRVDCIGVKPQKCYLIKSTQYEDWRFWYGEIEGFDFEEGYAYEIQVLERRIEDPPADAADVQLELVEVLLKVETFETPTPRDPSPPPPAPAEPQPVEPEPTEPEPLDLEPVEVVAPAPEPPQPVPAEIVAPEPEPAPPVLPEPVAAPPKVEPTAPVQPIAPPVAVAPSATPGKVLRGHLTIGAGIEARSFKLCGAEDSLWVEDRTDSDLWSLYRRLSNYPNRPVFMEVAGELTEAPPDGFGAHFQQQILIREVRNASVESAGCFATPAQFAFRASGNEPFWNVEISKRGLTFSELGQDGKILFPYSPPTFFGEQIIYRSQIRSHQPRNLVVRLEESPCNDSMADAAFSFTATVKIDDRTLTGCAREGEEEP